MPTFVAGNENKAAFIQKTTTAIACKTGSCVATQIGGDAPPQVGELPFWVFSVAMIWRGDDPIDLPGLFGFGPKPGYFVVQKRNETIKTITVVPT
ncbi:MAG: hypothetical protein SOX83_09040 [Sodaliphilus sp.]|nr:hypothetical protein [Sodaliphilus sp.]